MRNKITNNLIVVLAVFLASVILVSPIAPVKAANITFSADTTLTFSPNASPVISVKSASTADTATISGTVLTTDVPAGSTFILKNTNGDLLGITPSGGKSVLQVDVASGYVSSLISGWTESSLAGPTVAHTLAVGSAGAWYRLTADGVTVNNYQSDSSSVLTFTYALGTGTTSFAVSSATGALGAGSGSGGTPIVGGSSSSSAPAPSPVISQTQTATVSQGGKINSQDLLAKLFLVLQAQGIKIPAGISKQIQSTVTSPTVDTSEPAEEPSVELQALTRGLSIGSKGDDVKILQQFLKDQGESIYPEGKVTGYFGQLTLKAVQKFQEEQEIAQKGVAGYGFVGPKTRAVINEMIVGEDVSADADAEDASVEDVSVDEDTSANEGILEADTSEPAEEPSVELQALTRGLSIGSKGDDVKILQQFLKDQGESIYPEGKVTGYFGQLTLKAVQKFQEEQEIAQKGVAGYGFVGPKTRAVINEMIVGEDVSADADADEDVSVGESTSTDEGTDVNVE